MQVYDVRKSNTYPCNVIVYGLMDRLTLETAMKFGPIPVAAWSKAWVCGCSLVGIGGLNSVRGMDVSVL